MSVKRFFISLAILLLGLILNITAQAATLAATMPIIIDTDASTDDAIAILYLLNNPKIAVKAIIVDRNAGSHANTATAHIGFLLQLADVLNIPVYSGLNKNPAAPPAYSDEILTLIDHAYLDTSSQPKNFINQAQLAQLIMQQPQAIQLLSLGSLTNIADLFQHYPAVKNHIQSMIIMGGAVHVPGNMNVVLPQTHNMSAELNIFVDPKAFNKVLASSIPITLVSLDITDKVPVTVDFLARLKQIHTPKARFVYHLLDTNLVFIQADQYDFWDPLAAYVMVNPKAISTKEIRISTITQAGDHYGQVIEHAGGYPVNFVTGVQQAAVEAAMLASL